mmetsp:Transcript_103998/g.298991  ORF Transcript_103998/g.298991 Transcript_103998/m.298991 type:complete len:138 (-) Transcript_103998:247-660(-)
MVIVSSTIESAPACRICLDGASSRSAGSLIQPCRCESFVHRSCLDNWRRAGVNIENVTRCEACRSDFRFDGAYRASKVGCVARVIWANIGYYCLDQTVPSSHLRAPSPCRSLTQPAPSAASGQTHARSVASPSEPLR